MPHFDKFLEWLCEEQDEITEDILTRQLQETNRDIGCSIHQLYGVLRETCIGAAKNSVMSYVEDASINGARLLQEFARERLHVSKVGLAALGQRITKPPKATLDTQEDHLREWDSDCRRWYRMTKQSPGELALVYLQDMLPEAAVANIELSKHDSLTVQQMRDFYKKIIAEEKSSRRKKAKCAGGLHEFVERLQLAEDDAGE